MPISHLGRIVGAFLLLISSSANSIVFSQCKSAGKDCDEGPPDHYANCLDASPEETKTEGDVLNELRNGNPVKLVKGTVIRGCFLHDLLTKNFGLPETGIIIDGSDGATVKGPVDIRNQQVSLNVKLANLTFGDFVMKRSHFLKGLSFEGSSFNRLDMEDAIIDFDLVLDRSTFPACPPFFKNVHVSTDLSLRWVKISGPADFTGAVIGGSFFADPGEDKTMPPTEFGGADFEGVTVGLDTSLDQARFYGQAKFNNANFNSLSIRDTVFCEDVHFVGTKIHDFTIGTNPARRFKGANLEIADLTFQYMSPEDWTQLKTFAEKANTGGLQTNREKGDNSRQFYASLEELFQKHGRSHDADDIYIAWKLREREDLHGFEKAYSWAQYRLVGYGRHSWWILGWSLPFLSLGMIPFCKCFMEPKDTGGCALKPVQPGEKGCPKERYCVFLYTLDSFIPIIRLGYADAWRPRAIGSRIYRPVHVLVGNLIVPIGLAAWVGIIK